MIASFLGDALADVLTHPVTVLAAIVVVPLYVWAWVVDLRNSRAEEPLESLGDWPDTVHVHIPGINNLPAKRRVKSCGPERLRAGDISWMFRPDDTVSWQGQPIPAAPARFTPRRVPAPTAAPALPAQLWPDLGPATQPTPAVWEVPALRDTRHVWVPAPEARAS